MKKNIAIASGKGGVGKSTVTAFLAQKLRKIGLSIGVIDADLYGPSIGHIFTPDSTPFIKKGKLAPAVCQGIQYVSSLFFGYEEKPVSVRAPLANNMISQFIEEVLWEDLDYLMVDFPPGTGDVQLTLMQMLNFDGAILVTTPQEVALKDMQKALQMFIQMKVPIYGVIENLSYLDGKEKVYPFGTGKVLAFCEKYSLNYLGALPIDERLSQACDDRVNLVQNVSKSTLESFELIIQKILALAHRESDHQVNFELLWDQNL